MDKSSEQCIRLLQRAKDVGDWDLCKELARFLMALDESGDSLREAMRWVDVRTESGDGRDGGGMARLQAPRGMGRGEGEGGKFSRGSSVGSVGSVAGRSTEGRSTGSNGRDGEDVDGGEDYFSSGSL